MVKLHTKCVGITVVERKLSSGGSTTVYVLQGLDCPNCAQKIEDHLNGLSDIAKATNKKSWQNVYFALAIKVVVMILGLVGFANMWLAVFADTGVSMLCLLNSMLILRRK